MKHSYILIKQEGDEIPINNPITIIGRSPECDLQIEDEGISRRHAQLEISEEGRIADLTFSVDGAYLAMVRAERTAQIYEVRTGRGIALMEPESFIYDITFSPDGRYLVTTCSDQTSRFWLWRPEDMIQEAYRRLCCNITEEEVHKYLSDKHLNKTHLGLP